MHEIRIDDEVMAELKKRAVEEDMVFSTHNDVLRKVLGLDNGAVLNPSPASITPERSVVASRSTRLWGSVLLREHPTLSREIKEARAHRDGTFYKLPSAFPAVLFDDGGYIVFKTTEEMRTNPRVAVHDRSERIHVHQGIQAIPGYVRCSHRHEAS